MTLAAFVALCSAAMAKPVQQQMVSLGSMSFDGNIVPVENLAESLQVAFDAGAKRISCRRPVCRTFRLSQASCLQNSRPASTQIPLTRYSRRWA